MTSCSKAMLTKTACRYVEHCRSLGRHVCEPVCHNVRVLSTVPLSENVRRVRRVQTITIVWMMLEAGLSLCAAWRARSPALAAFGGDSAVELLSAVVVLWRFRTHASEDAERRAARIAGGLLFALAAYVVFAATMALLGASSRRQAIWGLQCWWRQRFLCRGWRGRSGAYRH